MNRIAPQQQFAKKPIPAISEAVFTPAPEANPTQPGSSSWLSPAMAIWIEQEEAPAPTISHPDTPPATR
jgi:hypothetical protein